MSQSNGLATLYPGTQTVDVDGAAFQITPLEIGDFLAFEQSLKAEKLARIRDLYVAESNPETRLRLQQEYLAYDLPSNVVQDASQSVAGTVFFVQRSLDRAKPGQTIPFLGKLNQLYILILGLSGVGPGEGKAEAAS